MNIWLMLLTLLVLGERIWKFVMVQRFFHRPVPPAAPVELVSFLQPILSGDPTMPGCLERNLRARSRYPREFIWLVDTNDLVGQEICRDLTARYPAQQINLVLMPPPGPEQNPKMVKLIAGAALARGDVLCVLDDDTHLPDGGLERCLPWLDAPGVGLAFGLPYYTSFGNFWSSLVAFFVNSHSLATYVPYTILSEPMTINGMFYAMRRPVFDAMGGFAGLEATLADDFAVARRVREQGLRLAQTPLCHGISTWVADARHYISLIQRWFIFPRESLMRHLSWQNLALLYSLAFLPVFFPWLVLLAALIAPSWWTFGSAIVYFVVSYAMFAVFNRQFFGNAAPWLASWLVPVIQITFPLQLLVALVAPQRINWRGHQMEVQQGGGFRFVRRRDEEP